MYMLSRDENEPLLSRNDTRQTPADTAYEVINNGRNHDSETATSSHGQDREESSRPLPKETSRIVGASYSFLVMGLINSSVGVMIPQLQRFYGLNDIHVSFLFLIMPLGYLLAAFANHNVHMRFGQRGIAILGPFCQLSSVCLICAQPPFILVLISSAIGAVGTGLLDGSWCAWAAGMKNANTTSGVLHGSYSFGASLGPFLASTMLSKIHRPWYDWYFFLSIAVVLEIIILFSAFRSEDAAKYMAEKSEEGKTNISQLAVIVKQPSVWMCAAYFLADVGTETTISGWIVTFVSRYHHGSLYNSGLCSSGFWIGMAAGRLMLGPVTDSVGIRSATATYLVLFIISHALFTISTTPVLLIATAALLGFFCGPLFPNGVVLLLSHLPSRLHVGAVSFVALIGQVGSALLPFALGALSQHLGMRVFPIVVFGELVTVLGLWVCFAKLPVRPPDLHVRRQTVNQQQSEGHDDQHDP